MKKLFLFISFSFGLTKLNAQCVASGPNNPSSGINNNSIGTVAWAGPGNVFTSNNSRATVSALLFGNISNYLVCTGFNFDIPATAIICGVQVQIEKSGTGLFQNIQDHSIRLVQNGNIVGSNYAVGGNWPGTDTYFAYGGANDLWGLTLTPADINSGNFGVAISSNLSGSVVLPSARIDHVRITIYFDNTLPIELLDFTAKRTEKSLVELFWSTASETNNAFFTVERSTDIKKWEERGVNEGAQYSSSLLNYTLVNFNAERTETYYRLKQTDYDGNFTYSDIISVAPDRSASDPVAIFPNPTKGTFTIQAFQKNTSAEIYSLSGELIYSTNLNEELTEIDLTELPKGIYIVKILSAYDSFAKRIIIQ